MIKLIYNKKIYVYFGLNYIIFKFNNYKNKMKVQVLARSFYEDAYLVFFIKYYLDLGFDRIVIFKADKEELGPLSLDFLKTDNEKSRVIIKYVVNEGNNIYKNKDNFIYYKDTEYDWSLHVDIDEFLVINREKYNSIHDYIVDIHKIMNVSLNDIYNIKFRWLCINKLNDNWDSNIIINNEFMNINDKSYISGSFYDYVLKNKLEIYSFIKGMYKTDKLIDNNEKMDAHIICFKDELNMDNRIVIDNTFTTINKYKSPLFGSNSIPKNNYCNGFILHFNTRSYSNALTKCLVTQLRENKKIKDLPEFVKFINNIDTNIIKSINNNEELDIIRKKFLSFLNSKAFFPNKIKNFNNKYNYLITNENYLQQIKTIINANNELIMHTAFIDFNKEIEILKMLCNKYNINYNNLKVILVLFNQF
jgi:hypothetical protein